jgi:hypothetical protein
MIFLNTGPGDDPTLNRHVEVTWTFSGPVLGVMSDTGGTLEAASSALLGASGTSYPSALAHRGLEDRDSYTITGNRVVVTMRVAEPGDWIRVVTANTPEPTSGLVFGGLFGIALLMQGRRRQR